MILIIDNYDSFTYNLAQIVAQQGVKTKVVRNDKISLPEIETLNPQGIILSPGPGTPEESGICIPLIRRFAGKIPILGVCLGLQAMAVAFGGVVDRSPEIMHGKSSFIYHESQGLYSGLPTPFKAGRYHSLTVDRQSLPASLICDSETQQGLVMGLRHKDYACFGVQFHPESVLTEHGDRLIANFLKFSIT